MHLTYFTIRVGADGALKSFGDIYGHNGKLIAAMGLDKPAIAPEVIADAAPVNELSP
ncbi:hypothetical protein D9M69_699620 [compost metagenome]